MSISEEWARRKDRLEAIAKAKEEIERRAAERHAREKEAYEQKVAERKKKQEATGKKPRGREPKEPEAGPPRARDQVNLTDSESRIMPISAGGFEQTYNAQVSVDMDSLLIVEGRERHNRSWKERFAEPPPLPEDAGAVDRMRHRLRTADGRALYAKRKSTVEVVFGIIQAVMGFRQFLLRGLGAVSGEWNLVCIAWNIKMLHALVAG